MLTNANGANTIKFDWKYFGLKNINSKENAACVACLLYAAEDSGASIPSSFWIDIHLKVKIIQIQGYALPKSMGPQH